MHADINRLARVAAWGVFAFALLFMQADSAVKADGGCTAIENTAAPSQRSLRGSLGPPSNPGHEDPATGRTEDLNKVSQLPSGATGTVEPPVSQLPPMKELIQSASRRTQVQEETGELLITTPTLEGSYVARESLCHIVQDEKVCTEIHSDVLPPDEYYDRLKPLLLKHYPKADPFLVDHVVSLACAFDTATAFAISFGVNKFQLAQVWVKLVGELVGRGGRKPNPVLIKLSLIHI